MYIVSIRKILAYTVENGSVSFRTKPHKTKYFLNEKRSIKQFKKWSEETHLGNEYIVDRFEVNFNEFKKVFFNKNKSLNRNGIGTLESCENDIPFINIQ